MKKILPISAMMLLVFGLIPSVMAGGDGYDGLKYQFNEQPNQAYTVAPMQDLVETLKYSQRRSSQLKKDAPFALPMMDIGQHTPNGIQPELMDVNGDGSSDIVFSFTNGLERYQGVLLNTGSGFAAVYTCGYTNANDPTGMFTYRGDCAEIR